MLAAREKSLFAGCWKWGRVRMWRNSKRFAFLLAAACILLSLYLILSVFSWDQKEIVRFAIASGKQSAIHFLPCVGVDGKLVSTAPLGASVLDGAYPRPFAGSYEDLGLLPTWMSYEQRYSRYGHSKDSDLNASSNQVAKRSFVDWAGLQYQCLARNAPHFTSLLRDATSLRDGVVRLNYRNQSTIIEPVLSTSSSESGRTAIVIRTYSGFDYDEEDLMHVRSLIVETSLQTGGRYQVILLVDIHHTTDTLKENIFDSPAAYQHALEMAGIPVEFRSIAILWDDQLLRDWYPRVHDHSTFYQVYQPLQLFALHYPEFDHIWQIEMDTRFLGDSGQFLDTLSTFARQEPRKQALERSTFFHMTAETNDYSSFAHAIDRVANGSSYAWGPVPIPDLHPIGLAPPTLDPRKDNFLWGVGEEADLIVTSYCMNATNSPHWPSKDWIYNFQQANATPRFLCPPAITRTSRKLLLAIHDAQSLKGLTIPGEATPISFALYHGLKISFPPQPLFWHVRDDVATRQGWWKGGPAASENGLGPRNTSHPSGDGLSFWWTSSWPRMIMDAWRTGVVEDGEEMPWILRRHNGVMYAPNMLLHPVKQRMRLSHTTQDRNSTTTSHTSDIPTTHTKARRRPVI